ncbi:MULTISPECIES: hypothetical protein [unclassified Geodermatophilus]|uniref:hypothetical protein n=1 Tax=unclassified Geodermatophilus TaxID=2637632 RepID=UPI003EE924E7
MDAQDRFTALVDALADDPGVTPPDADGGRRFGSATLRAGGSIFAMLVQGALVLKLPGTRVEALLAAGTGAPFGNGKGQPYREWVTLPDGDPASDLPLAREALEFVRSRRR